MPGEAKTQSFMLGTATVMLGPPANVFDLTPEQHSIGLVKNFRISTEPAFTDLSQGVKNTTVYSVQTANAVRASMEVYEYTGQNLAYALGLEGTAIKGQSFETTVDAEAAADSATLTLAEAGELAVGDHIMIYPQGVEGQVIVRRVTEIASPEITLSQAVTETVPSGSIVRKSNVLDVGSKEDADYLGAKIVGQLADRSEVVVLCPKIRVTSGFSVGFTTDNFDNMPFEFSFYDLVANDPHYREFRNSQAKLFTTK